MKGDCAHYFIGAAGIEKQKINAIPESMSRILLSLGLAAVAGGGGNGTTGADKMGEFKNGGIRILPAYPRRGRQIDRDSPRKKEG